MTQHSVRANWKRGTFAIAITAIVATALTQPEPSPPSCYKPKEPIGCADCGRSTYMGYCEEGCEVGSPGRTGPGTLTQFYCYTIPPQQHATGRAMIPCPRGGLSRPALRTATVCAASSRMGRIPIRGRTS